MEVRIRTYAAILQVGRRLFEPGVYDPAAEDAEELAEARRSVESETDRAARKRLRNRLYHKFHKPAGACSNSYCRRQPPPGYRVCDVCRARQKEYRERTGKR